MVLETIDVDFLENKHGIFRDIPYVYTDNNGKKTYTEVNVVSVLQDGKAATIKKTTGDSYLNIRIGDADRTIFGDHKYQIMYTVKGVVLPYDSYDELYWDVTGNGWDAPIASATATVKLFKDSILSSDCYQGAYASNELCQALIENQSTSKYYTTRNLAAGEGMSIVAGFDKGTVPILSIARPKTFGEKFFSWTSISTLLMVLIAGVGTVVYLWFKNGRDFWYRGISGTIGIKNAGEVKPIGAHEPVVVEYTPPEKLPPALIGVLLDERADTLDITATIIDLASRGYFTITEIPKKWIFGKVDYLLSEKGKDQSKLFAYEKELLTRLFTKKEIKTSELKLKFYDDLAKVKEKLYEDAVSQKLFPHNPNSIRTKYLSAGIIILVAGIFVTAFSISASFVPTADLGLAAVVVGLVTLIFSQFMSKRTAKGRELYRRIKGYRVFIDRAESYKQKFFENKNIFTEVLPYTIVFGLTQKFARQMEDIGLKPQNPSWYTGVHAFNLSSFSDNINSFSSSMSNAIASTPSSSGSGGGGFSGGGFGGGGGGSW